MKVGLVTFVDFLGFSHVFGYIIAYNYHVTSATPTYLVSLSTVVLSIIIGMTMVSPHYLDNFSFSFNIRI